MTYFTGTPKRRSSSALEPRRDAPAERLDEHDAVRRHHERRRRNRRCARSRRRRLACRSPVPCTTSIAKRARLRLAPRTRDASRTASTASNAIHRDPPRSAFVDRDPTVSLVSPSTAFRGSSSGDTMKRSARIVVASRSRRPHATRSRKRNAGDVVLRDERRLRQGGNSGRHQGADARLPNAAQAAGAGDKTWRAYLASRT